MNVDIAAAPQRLQRKLYSYVVTHDTGFAPNPFFGYCTLACCRPVIRRNAGIGDWVVGLTPKRYGNDIVYFMRVDEILPSFDLYWHDPRFANKKPRFDATLALKCGDNIYQPQGAGDYRQLRSMHSRIRSDDEDPERKAHDLKGKRVLISNTFAYFGGKPAALPPELKTLIVGERTRAIFQIQ